MSLSLLMAANLAVSSAARRKAEDSPGAGDVLATSARTRDSAARSGLASELNVVDGKLNSPRTLPPATRGPLFTSFTDDKARRNPLFQRADPSHYASTQISPSHLFLPLFHSCITPSTISFPLSRPALKHSTLK
jgi:hypothetical protein